jgi:uncharacterized OB-fold protein
MSPEAVAPSPQRKARPIVPFLRLGNDADKPHLVAKKCANCGAVYLGTRVACSCFSPGSACTIHILTA